MKVELDKASVFVPFALKLTIESREEGEALGALFNNSAVLSALRQNGADLESIYLMLEKASIDVCVKHDAIRDAIKDHYRVS
jgi:hypothetical protein